MAKVIYTRNYDQDRLELKVSQKDETVYFTFRTLEPDCCNMSASFDYHSPYLKSALSHTSGTVSRGSMINMTSLLALRDRLGTLLRSGLTDEQILQDNVIGNILSASYWKRFVGDKL